MTRLFMFALAIAMPAAARAATFQNTAALDKVVAAFTGHAIGEEGGARTAIDPRLKLAQCATVALSWRSARHDAVVVTCADPDWHVFVAVDDAAPAAVLAAAAPGMVAPPIKREPVIKRGDPVMIEAGEPGFSISREAVAMGNAAPGERFMAKADGAQQPIQAIAVESGRATLPGWTD